MCMKRKASMGNLKGAFRSWMIFPLLIQCHLLGFVYLSLLINVKKY